MPDTVLSAEVTKMMKKSPTLDGCPHKRILTFHWIWWCSSYLPACLPTPFFVCFGKTVAIRGEKL